MAQVAKWKTERVAELKDLILSYPVVGIVDMEGIPSRQLQRIRELLREEVLIKMSRKSLMLRALEKAATEEKSVEGLIEHVDGQAAFIFSKMNPFKLNIILEKNKSTAPAKVNAIAPKDIVIPKGETQFEPGPILSELRNVGVKTTLQGGKVAVKEDAVVVRKGERISQGVATILNRLEIEPVEVGLSLKAAHEGKVIYTPDILAVDTEKVIKDIQLSNQQAFNLSINSGFLTKSTAMIAVCEAFNRARNLAVSASIFESGVIDIILKNAQMKALSLNATIKDSWDRELKESAKEEGGKKEESKPVGEKKGKKKS